MKPTVTIGIPAYNEAANIGQVLCSLLLQRTDNYLLNEIIVISDGSSDATVSHIKQVTDPRIKLIVGRRRLGKPARLNQIFSQAKGRIVVLIDADVLPASPDTISHLINPLNSGSEIVLTSGLFLALPPRTFLESCVNASRQVYNRVKLRYKNGDNAFFCGGKLMALSSAFAKSVVIPSIVAADDVFLYFSCITRGFKFKHVSQATVWFRSPSTLNDQIKQNLRYVSQGKQLREIFGSIVDRELHLPKRWLYESLLVQLFIDPLPSIGILFVNLLSKLLAKIQPPKFDRPGWIIATTTKKDINL